MKQFAKILSDVSKPQLISMEEELMAVADANDAKVETETALDEAERALDITGALEDLHFVADTIKEATPREVALMQIVSNTALAGTDVSADTIAYESEEAPENRTAKIKAVIKRILDFIKELMAKVMEHVKDFIASIVSTMGNVQKRVEQATERFNDAEHQFDSKEKIDVKSFPVGKKTIAEARDVTEALKEYTKAVQAFRKDNAVHVAADAKVFESIFNGQDAYATFIDSTTSMIRESEKAKNDTLKETLAVTAGDFVAKTYSTSSLIGGIVINYRSFSGDFSKLKEQENAATVKETIEMVSKIGYVVSKDSERVAGAKVKATAYGKEEIKALIGVAKEMAEMLGSQGEGLIGELSSNQKACAKVVDAISKGIAKYDSAKPEASVMANASKPAIAHLTQQYTAPHQSLISVTYNLINQCLAIVKASLDAHEAAVKA